jgi:predicted  nucleic acid-binding Zn-ribbon protein
MSDPLITQAHYLGALDAAQEDWKTRAEKAEARVADLEHGVSFHREKVEALHAERDTLRQDLARVSVDRLHLEDLNRILRARVEELEASELYALRAALGGGSDGS